MVHGYTTIEQSKKLLSLGLDPSTADMCYVIDYSAYDKIGKDKYNVQIDHYGCLIHQQDNIPCWSLTALLKLIPYTIKDDFSKCIFQMSKYDTGYQISYVRESNHHCAILSYYEELVVDAAFKMVCRLIEQGHIKVNK